MHWSGIFTFAICASTVAAHAAAHEPHQPVPRVAGNRKLLSELGVKRGSPALPRKPRQPGPIKEYATEGHEKRGEVEERQSAPERCGRGRGNCAAGYCCSSEGWCGKGDEYCRSPDCQITYGPACDGNQKPSGVDTSTVPRPKVGKVPYGGVGIYDCETVGDIAITFDDGPWDYTSDLLDMFAAYKAKATFFITGTNLHKGKLNDRSLPWASIIQRMAAEGHQIASHTWSHENFSQTTTTQARNQMIWNEIALNDILGYIPTYMRPPYSICPQSCQKLMADLGYHIVYFDLDTEGYLHTEPNQIQRSRDIWDAAVEGTDACETGYLQIEHDIHYQVVYNLTGHILESLFRNGYRSVTVGECLGDPPENWYRAGPGHSTVPPYTHALPTPTCGAGGGGPQPPKQTSVEGDCGNGITCLGSQFGDCCSQHGWCGSTAAYCGDGCQSAFGKCDGGSGGGAPVSKDGSCGGAGGATCVGSTFGNCCSQYGWCGSSADHCGTGCQSKFGSGCK